MTASLSDRAARVISELEANGAVLDFKPAEGVLPSSFVYSLPRGGDRWKCRGLIVYAKADCALWQAVVAEVGRRHGRGAA